MFNISYYSFIYNLIHCLFKNNLLKCQCEKMNENKGNLLNRRFVKRDRLSYLSLISVQINV